MPTITTVITIAGTTQPRFAGTPIIEVTGNFLSETAETSGWSVLAEAKLTPGWSLIGRLDSYYPDESISENREKRHIAGVCHHIGGGTDLLLDYDLWEFEQPSRSQDDRIQFTVQVKF